MLVTVAAVVALMAYLAVGDAMRAADGSGGLSLLSARAGVAVALVMAIVGTLPGLAIGASASATGHPLTGVFAVTLGLGLFTLTGGSTQEWAQRVALPRGYWGLCAEVVVWSAWLVGMLAVLYFARAPLRSRLTLLVDDEHFGRDMTLGAGGAFSYAGAAVCVVVSGAIAFFLLRSPGAGQVFGSLLLAFTIGSFTGQMLTPSRHAGPMLLSPLVLALLVYAYVAINFDTQAELLAAWYNQTPGAATPGPRLPGPAMALPIQYVSAGVAGCTLGYGLAQAFDVARAQAAEAAGA